jgi:hypothetical protein
MVRAERVTEQRWRPRPKSRATPTPTPCSSGEKPQQPPPSVTPPAISVTLFSTSRVLRLVRFYQRLSFVLPALEASKPSPVGPQLPVGPLAFLSGTLISGAKAPMPTHSCTLPSCRRYIRYHAPPWRALSLVSPFSLLIHHTFPFNLSIFLCLMFVVFSLRPRGLCSATHLSLLCVLVPSTSFEHPITSAVTSLGQRLSPPPPPPP